MQRHALLIYWKQIRKGTKSFTNTTSQYAISLSLLQLKLDLPDKVTSKSEKAQFQATQLNSEEKFSKAATFSIPYCEEQFKRVFNNELTNFPSALTE